MDSVREKTAVVERHKRLYLVNTYVDDVTMDESVQIAEEAVIQKKPIFQISINANKINLIQKNPELRSIINESGLNNADGTSVLWAAKLFGHSIKEKVAGCDLFQNLVRLSAEKGYRVYFLGAKEETVKRMVEVLCERYPSLTVAGYRNGYFSEQQEPQIVDEIAAAKPDFLFAALSSPKQEYFLHRYWDRLGVGYAMGVGGSFDVVAGTVKRAPQWMIDHSLEWLYRFCREPKKRFYSCLVSPAKFVLLVLRTKLFH